MFPQLGWICFLYVSVIYAVQTKWTNSLNCTYVICYWGSCYSIFSLIYIFLLAIVLAVLVRFTVSDYLFGIFKLFLRFAVCYTAIHILLYIIRCTIAIQKLCFRHFIISIKWCSSNNYKYSNSKNHKSNVINMLVVIFLLSYVEINSNKSKIQGQTIVKEDNCKDTMHICITSCILIVSKLQYVRIYRY